MALTAAESTTASGLADDGTDSVTVRTGSADDLFILIDNNAGGDHSGYELTIEVDTSNGFKEYTTLGGDGTDAETARSWDLPALGRKMKVTLTNRSGGTADHALDVLAENYGGKT